MEDLRETLEFEDLKGTGTMTNEKIRECFESLDLLGGDQIDDDKFDFLIFQIYKESASLDKLEYRVIFELFEGSKDDQSYVDDKFESDHMLEDEGEEGQINRVKNEE